MGTVRVCDVWGRRCSGQGSGSRAGWGGCRRGRGVWLVADSHRNPGGGLLVSEDFHELAEHPLAAVHVPAVEHVMVLMAQADQVVGPKRGGLAAHAGRPDVGLLCPRFPAVGDEAEGTLTGVELFVDSQRAYG